MYTAGRRRSANEGAADTDDGASPAPYPDVENVLGLQGKCKNRRKMDSEMVRREQSMAWDCSCFYTLILFSL